jgi:GH18 family chitinase
MPGGLAKGAYARSMELGGTIAWTINQAQRGSDFLAVDGLLAETSAAFR